MCVCVYIAIIHEIFNVHDSYIFTELNACNMEDLSKSHTHRETHIFYTYTYMYIGFPGDSLGRESACSVGDSSLIPG